MVSRLNLGILAHVDAGKTSLTERLLFAAGVIGEVGSVDDGSTQADTLALERQRGITIRSAVVSFGIGDLTVNLVDTPGHPDFIAEVERVLGVLDGAVLVISAVEGVQAQTRVLLRTLQRLRVPALVFVNKIDRAGADDQRVLRDIRARLTRAVVPMGTVRAAGTPAADFAVAGPADAGFTAGLADALADHDDELLAALVEDETAVSYRRLRAGLVTAARQGLVHPVYFGSAITGAGVAALTGGIRDFLPRAAGAADGPVAGTVFKVERGAAGEKIAYVRIFSGTVRARERVRFGSAATGKVTAIGVFDRGPAAPREQVAAGQIGKLRGLDGVRAGDWLGAPDAAVAARQGRLFAPPTLETVVVPDRPADSGALRAALGLLAEQDPLINVRQDDIRQEIVVSLYGEVQKEVIQATLAADFGIDVGFRQSTTLCIERPSGTGAAAEFMTDEDNPFRATAGLVLMTALRRAGTRVHEPIHRFTLEIPADTLALVLPVLARLDATPGTPRLRGSSCLVEGDIRAVRVHHLQQQLASLTRGEGVLDTALDRHQPVHGQIPVRPRSDHNPLNRKEYLLYVRRRAAGQANAPARLRLPDAARDGVERVAVVRGVSRDDRTMRHDVGVADGDSPGQPQRARVEDAPAANPRRGVVRDQLRSPEEVFRAGCRR